MVITIITLIILLIFLLEYLYIYLILKTVPLRIHINGTRGKSTTTELITLALQVINYRTIGKITGVIPTIIFPNGEKKIIKRRGEARLTEQLKIIKLAKKLSVKAIVLECMSVTPEYQKFETLIFKPNIYVITNIRYDHAEQMGTNIEEMIHAICSPIPKNCTVVTAEKVYVNKIIEYASIKNSRVITVDSNDIPNYIFYSNGIHPSCMALALKISEIIGLDKNIILEQLFKLLQNHSPLINRVKTNDKIIHFVNGFAINDVQSAEEFVKTWCNKLEIKNFNIILNTRNDRPLRTLEFIKWITTLKTVDKVFLSGNHKYFARHKLLKSGYDQNQIVILNKNSLQNLDMFSKLLNKKHNIVFGLGNIKGDGFRIIDLFKQLNNTL